MTVRPPFGVETSGRDTSERAVKIALWGIETKQGFTEFQLTNGWLANAHRAIQDPFLGVFKEPASRSLYT